jgi:uncharacterized protein YbaP (TraB family)
MLDAGQTNQSGELEQMLSQSRIALSELRADDLVDLQSRAESLEMTILGLHSIDLLDNPLPFLATAPVKREHRLLKDLLQATRQNLDVLTASSSRGTGIAPGREGVRWVR